MKGLSKYFFLKRKKLHHLLAYKDKLRLKNDPLILLYKRVGLYSEIVGLDTENDTQDIHAAKILAYYKLGKLSQADRLLEAYLNRYRTNLDWEKLRELVVVNPEKLYRFLENQHMRSNNLYPYLLAMYDKEQASVLLEQKINNKEFKQNPELLLLYSNLTETVTEKIRWLNEFLRQYDLKALTLKEKKDFILSNLNAISRVKQPMSHTPTVSIIMTTYNSGKTVDYAIESVLSQTYTDFELIIVDDASTDSTVEKIGKYTQTDRRITLIKLSENRGTYVAKNTALKQARGDYVTFHDSDDYSHPQKIALQVKRLLEKKYIASVSYWVRMDLTGMYVSRYIYPLMRINLSSLMFRREKVIHKIGYFDRVRVGADSEFFNRLMLVFGKKRIDRIRKPLSFGLHHDGSLMNHDLTGYDEKGYSFQRISYWECWNRWHIKTIQNKNIPYVGFMEKIQYTGCESTYES